MSIWSRWQTAKVFKNGGPALPTSLIDILAIVFELEIFPSDWMVSMLIVLVFKKGWKSSCDNYRGISLTNMVSILLVSVLVWCLNKTHEIQIWERQSSFIPSHGCLDQIFAIRQVIKHKDAFRCPTPVVFATSFESVDWVVLWWYLSLKSVPHKCTDLVKALYSNAISRVKAHDELSPEVMTSSGVCQGCSLSPFLFSFLMDLLLEMKLSSSKFSGIDLLSWWVWKESISWIRIRRWQGPVCWWRC